MNDTTKAGFQTNCIHAGERRPSIEGAVGMPIFQNTTYEYTGAKSYEEVRYTRLSNSPNHVALALKLSALEKTESALVTSSGMSAIDRPSRFDSPVTANSANSRSGVPAASNCVNARRITSA